MCFPFKRVVQRGKGDVTVATLQGKVDKVVGKMRVARQDGAVEVGAENGAGATAFKRIFTVVALAYDTPAERHVRLSEIGFSGMAFETDHCSRFQKIRVYDDVAGNLVLTVDCPHVQQAKARNSGVFSGCEKTTTHLISPACCEHHHTTLYSLTNSDGFTLDHIVRYKRLLAPVLAPAEQKYIEEVRGHRVSGQQRVRFHRYTAPPATVRENEQVAVIAIDTHTVRIKNRCTEVQVIVHDRV